MHPDQATEPIVDLALRLGVPFAVVPCCVYPGLFPFRVQKGTGVLGVGPGLRALGWGHG